MTSSTRAKIGAFALLGLSLTAALTASQPANAQWRNYGWGYNVYAPPVVVAPPAAYYYAPPPAYYAPPSRVWIPAHWQNGYWIPGHWS